MLNKKTREPIRFSLFLNHGENTIELDDDLVTEFNSTLIVRNASIFWNHEENTIELDDDLVTEFNSTLIVRNASIFWNHENIITGVNDTFTYDSNTIKLEQGYWTFDLIQKFLSANSIAVESLEHNSKCKIQAKSGAMDLKKFGLLLGFPEFLLN